MYYALIRNLVNNDKTYVESNEEETLLAFAQRVKQVYKSSDGYYPKFIEGNEIF